ncbi:Hydroxyproline O-galactosyltransferase HPGT1 [Linum perenne]
MLFGSGGGKVSGNRGSGSGHGSRISTLLFSMFATFASIYVAGRLWQDSQHRVRLIKELDRITGQGQSAISVDDTLKIIACREQQKKLLALETELVSAKQEGFSSEWLTDNGGARPKKRQLVVIGVMTVFGNKNNRDAVRKAWMGSGESLNKMETDKGTIARFVIGRSATRGDTLDRAIDSENTQTNDFIVLDDHVEGIDGLSKKAKLFFAHAVNKWDADYYAKVNDNIYVNIDTLGATLATYLDKPRAYVGCMKSGEVFSEQTHKWYEPDWWKFGDKKSYFRHASGEMYVLSGALAKFISINKSMLRSYAHDDVSTGSWFIGLDAQHVDESKFCCSSWSSGIPLSLSSFRPSSVILFDFLASLLIV